MKYTQIFSSYMSSTMPSPLPLIPSSKMQVAVNSLVLKQAQAIKALPSTFVDPQRASPDIADLVRDPEEFLKHHSIDSGMMFSSASTNASLPGFAKLVAMPDDKNALKNYMLMSHDPHGVNAEQSSANAIPAAFLCLNPRRINPRVPAYIDISISNPKEKFIFTSELNGSSIIVTKKDESTYRVFHDSRICSSVLYDNVVLAIDYCEYGDEYDKEARHRRDFATVCFHYESSESPDDKGQWVVYCQYQQETTGFQRALRLNDCESPVQKVKAYQAPQVSRIRNEFNRFVRAEGETFFQEPLPFIMDGTFEVITDTDAMLTNPAVASTERLRRYMMPYGNGLRTAITEAKIEKSKETTSDDMKITLEAQIDELEKNLRHHDYLINTSERLDYTYLWLRQKQIVNPLEAPRVSLAMVKI
ncbi:hypothetical protein P170DRAFT_469539 [Aspergillus steynii IBT 23096]|uniref:Uncharacterized protein n=1 Tax=Aspergillus steynii IBT 23096 TaxID=1392250 RepID=A0A2I2GMI3_9EURO|nr:uncharacterized protein P170DRAFT_469539 [Aspergillus steynii IBT 23096]PLB54070.1 hypothetical protein P170DRAFT_469539 [Aspergillus steynii IBT 23096]